MAIMNKAKQEKSFPRGSVESKPLGTDSSNLPPSQKVLKRKVEKDLFSNKEKVVKKKKLKKAKKDENKENLNMLVWISNWKILNN